MTVADDYPAMVNEATLDQGATQLSHECAQALEEIKRLRKAFFEAFLATMKAAGG